MGQMVKCRLNALADRIRPFRTAFISVMVGIFAVVLVSVISSTGSWLINKELDSLGMDSMLLASADTQALVLDSEVYAAVSQVSGVAVSSPILFDAGSCRFGERAEQDVFFWGVNAQADQMVALQILYGRMFSPLEVTNGDLVCVIDSKLALDAYGRENVTGKEITLIINGVAQNFTVVGVAQAGSSLLNSVAGNIIPNFIYLPYTTLSFFSAKNGYDEIAFKTSSAANTEEVRRKVSETAGQFCTEQPEDFVRIQDLFGQRDTVQGLVSIASVVMGLIAGVALVVSGISVMSAVASSVRRRRREIGIRKSLGAPMSSILLELIADAMLSTTVALCAGLFASFALLGALLHLLGLPQGGNLPVAAAGCAAMLLIALIFSFFPAYKAARMRPVDALREWE